VSFVIGRSKLPLVSIVVDRGSSSGSPAQPLALSISVKAQSPWTPPDYAAKNPVTEIEPPAINRDEGTVLCQAGPAPKLDSPDAKTLDGLRDRAILSVGLQVGLRQAENRHPESRRLHQNRGFDSLRIIRKGGFRPEERIPCPVQYPHCSCRTAARQQTVQNSCAAPLGRSLQEGAITTPQVW
jgi:hypothetical protein